MILVIRDTTMGGSVTTDEWVGLGLLNADGTYEEGTFKTTAQGTST